MSKQFILEIENFIGGSLPLASKIISYSFPTEIGARIGGTGGAGRINGIWILRPSDKNSPLFVQYSASGQFIPKISFMETAMIRGGVFKRPFLTCTEVIIDNFGQYGLNGNFNEEITFSFKDYRLNL